MALSSAATAMDVAVATIAVSGLFYYYFSAVTTVPYLAAAITADATSVVDASSDAIAKGRSAVIALLLFYFSCKFIIANIFPHCKRYHACPLSLIQPNQENSL